MRRKARAVELTAALATPRGTADGRAKKGAARKAIAAKKRARRAVVKMKAPARKRFARKNIVP
jgi:hypothetical protein